MKNLKKILPVIMCTSILVTACGNKTTDDGGDVAVYSYDQAPSEMSNEDMESIVMRSVLEQNNFNFVKPTQEQLDSPEVKKLIEANDDNKFPVSIRLRDDLIDPIKENALAAIESGEELPDGVTAEDIMDLQPLTESEIAELAKAAEVLGITDRYYLDTDENTKNKILVLYSLLKLMMSSEEVELLTEDRVEINKDNLKYDNGNILYDKDSVKITNISDQNPEARFNPTDVVEETILVYDDNKWKIMLSQYEEDYDILYMIVAGRISSAQDSTTESDAPTSESAEISTDIGDQDSLEENKE